MPEDQPQIVEELRRRPLRSAAIIALIAIGFLSAAVVRRHVLRNAALRDWAAQSTVMTRLTGTSAAAWLSARDGDARLLAASAARTPQLFGLPPTPGKPAIPRARINESLSRSLASLNNLHAYTSVWLFDASGRPTGAAPAREPSAAIRRAALAALVADSATPAGPYLTDSGDLEIAVAHRVVSQPVGSVTGDTIAGRVMGSVVLTMPADPLLANMASWTDRSAAEMTSIVVATSDSVIQYALTPDRARGALRGAWNRPDAPASALAAYATKMDTTAALTDSDAVFSSHISGLPWALMRRAPKSVVFASVNGRLSTEASTTAAIVFMIAIIIIGRRQTARERKLREVAESEVRYRLLANNATDVIARHAPDGRILYISPAVEAILGYRPRQLIGHYPSELLHEDDPTTTDDILQALRSTRDTSRAEHQLRHVDGHYVWVETTGRAVRDPVWGQVTEFVTVSRDIEDRKQTEEALRSSEEEYRMLFDANPLPMWAFDADNYKFVAVNDEAVAHYGYSREEFLGMTIFDIRPPEDVQVVKQRVDQVRNGLTNLQGARHRKKDGSIMDVDMTVHEVKLSGRMTRLVLVKDMTEARRTATALRESNELIRALFDSSPVAIIATDMNLRVLQWNGAAERLFGWTAAEIVGRDYPLATEEMFAEVLSIRERALQDGTFIDVQVNRCRKDGSTVDLSLSVGVIRDALSQPNGFVVLAADISERARLEHQLRHAQKMEAVGQLAGGIAHDFNNLLTVVTGYAGILLADLDGDSPMRSDIQEIVGAADRAGVLTRQLLAYSRQQLLQPQDIDLNSIVEQLEHMVRRVMPADIRITTTLAPELATTNADPGQIEQVLMNLIVNARDAMPDGGTLTIETANAHVSESDTSRYGVSVGSYAVLAVSDNGSGMSADVQSHMFEPFFTTKARGEGTGLGLSTAHGIVTQSGGYLTVASEPGLGTTIKVWLPSVEQSARNAVAPATYTIPQRNTAVILLAEDDAAVRLATTRILEKNGYTVLVAVNGSEALEIHEANSSKIDLLITDIIMPEMSGRDLVAQIHERDPQMAVLVMSGYTEHTSRNRELVDAGMAFIQKPFTPDQLLASVQHALNSAGVHAHS